MQQLLVIVTGLPFSGKTTLTKKLVARFGFDVASVDEFLDNHYVVEKMTQKDWDKVFSMAYAKLEKLLNGGKSVIFDGASLLKSERDLLKAIAKRFGVRSKLVYLKTPVNEIKQRWNNNIQNPTRDHVEEETLKQALDMFEEPADSEDPIIFKPDMDFDQWAKQNFLN